MTAPSPAPRPVDLLEHPTTASPTCTSTAPRWRPSTATGAKRDPVGVLPASGLADGPHTLRIVVDRERTRPRPARSLVDAIDVPRERRRRPPTRPSRSSPARASRSTAATPRSSWPTTTGRPAAAVLDLGDHDHAHIGGRDVAVLTAARTRRRDRAALRQARGHRTAASPRPGTPASGDLRLNYRTTASPACWSPGGGARSAAARHRQAPRSSGARTRRPGRCSCAARTCCGPPSSTHKELALTGDSADPTGVEVLAAPAVRKSPGTGAGRRRGCPG